MVDVFADVAPDGGRAEDKPLAADAGLVELFDEIQELGEALGVLEFAIITNLVLNQLSDEL